MGKHICVYVRVCMCVLLVPFLLGTLVIISVSGIGITFSIYSKL